MADIHSLLAISPYVLADGAMGTMLFASGLQHGGAPELWNLEAPERVAAVHRGYLEAGSQILLTNTFGGTGLRLALHGLQDCVHELNLAAVHLLREEIATSGKNALVAGDIGPSGQVLSPYGDLSFSEAVKAFREQAAALVEGGADLIWIETMSDMEEVRAAVEAVRQVSSEIPIFTTMTFDTHGRTMMGVTPEKAVARLLDLGATAVGGNCGNGPQEIVEVIEKMHSARPEATLVAKANAGIPELIAGKVVYRASPEIMAEYALQVYEAGARIIGACCGSTPAHVRAIAQAMEPRRVQD